MLFEMRHKFFKSAPLETFTEDTAPVWLTSINTVRGSTMDNRWFWIDHVLAMKVNESIETDFRTIKRVQ